MPAAARNPAGGDMPPAPVASWKWREGHNYKIPASVVGSELERLASLSGADVPSLSPGEIVRAASDPASPLHSFFEWRDDVAAVMARKQQARSLVRQLVPVMIVAGPPSPPIRAAVRIADPEPTAHPIGFVSVKVGGQSKPSYVKTSLAMELPDLRVQVLRDALVYLKGAQKRFGLLEELGEVYEAINRADAKHRRQAGGPG